MSNSSVSFRQMQVLKQFKSFQQFLQFRQFKRLTSYERAQAVDIKGSWSTHSGSSTSLHQTKVFQHVKKLTSNEGT
jgi:hypothetical protein